MKSEGSGTQNLSLSTRSITTLDFESLKNMTHHFFLQGWVTCVDWCKGNDQTFVSGSHDTVLKMWDIRAFKTPLFDLKGHSEQVLCCSWSEPSIIVSGGADNDMKIFKSGRT